MFNISAFKSVKAYHRPLTIALGLIAALNVQAGEWIADADTQCQVWNSSPMTGDSMKWSGKCLKGKASGRGILQWSVDGVSTDRYEGECRDGNKHGKGTYTWANGNRYEGDWRDGKQSGKGVFTSSSGDHYEGDWRDGKQNGKGIFKWSDGDYYEGEYRDDKRNGLGILSLSTENQAHPNGVGEWVGGRYVLQGMFEDGVLVLTCSSKANCKEAQARKEREDKAQAQRDAERDRHLQKCEHIHDGKRFKDGKGFFASTYEVIGFSSYTGKATVENVYNKNERFEISCYAIPE